MSHSEKHEARCPADVGLGECCCMFKEYNERGDHPPPDPALALLRELVACHDWKLRDAGLPRDAMAIEIYAAEIKAAVRFNDAWAAARAHLKERG